MERKTFKGMTRREKIAHIWEYYRWVVLGSVAALAVVIYMIVQMVTPKPEILMNTVLVNANSFEIREPDVFKSYLEAHGYDTKHETIHVNTSMYLDVEHGGAASARSYQALAAMLLVGEVDLLVGDTTVMDLVGAGQGLVEMSELLPPELLERYQDSLYTVTDAETGEAFVCGIWLPEGHVLQQDGYYGERVLAAIPYTAVNRELAEKMLLCLLGE